MMEIMDYNVTDFFWGTYKRSMNTTQFMYNNEYFSF